MKQLLHILHHSRLRSSLTLLLLCLILWFFGPYIAIAGHSILASIDHRLIAILLLALAWKYNISGFINKFSQYARLQTTRLQPKPSDPQSTTLAPPHQEIKFLRQDIKANWLQLKKLQQKRFFRRIKKPAYLLFGTTKCGKSTLIKQHDQDLCAEPVANYKFGASWLSTRAIFLELNTDFLMTETALNSLSLLHYWFKFIKRFRRLQSWDGCIFTLNFSVFFSQSRQQQQTEIQKYCTVIQQAVNYKSMPIFIVFTQCDLIAGFSEFFADLGPEERAQTLGIPFAMGKAGVFEMQYAALVKRLNERVIWRLHQEHTQEKRNRIKDFPLQFEIIRPAITELMQQINHVNGAKLMGCYFTSCVQSMDTAVDFLAKPITEAFNLQPLLRAAERKTTPHKNFFTHDLLMQIIPSIYLSQPKQNNLYWSFGIYALCVAVLCTGSFYFYHSYQDNTLAIKSIQHAIVNAKTSSVTDKDYAFLPKLVMLSDAMAQMSHHHLLNIAALGRQKTQQLATTAQNTYQQILLTQFIPLLKQKLEATLSTTANSQDPNDLYSALEAYLMLSNPAQRNPEFIVRWFSAYWQKTLVNKPIERTQLEQQLTLALQQPFKITVDKQIVIAARNTLSQIPLTQLSYSVLLDHYNQPVKLFATNYVLKVNDQYSIPSLYTAANFNEIYNDQIAKACQQVMQGNWVLGAKPSSATADKIAIAQLVDQVQMLYLNQYADAWTTLLTTVNILNIQNIIEANSTLNVLGNKNSPLWQLLQTIYINTAPNNAVPQFAQVSDNFQTLDTFIISPSANNLMHNLTNLKNYLAKINAAKDISKAAFAASAQRMIDDGQNDDALESLYQQTPSLPQPLQTWIGSITTATWQAMLLATRDYLNYEWSTAVLPQYNATMNNRYPLFPHAKTDITITNFSKFFSPDGTLSAFFNFYLKPFVDTNKVYWVWRKIDDQTLNIPQTTLEMFMRATLIQKMYFADGHDKPLVKFSLIPTGLEPGVSDFKLNIAGQVINYQSGQTTAEKLFWPGTNTDRVSLQFINNQGQPSATMLQGPWAWFRLLSNANLQKTANPRLFNLTFDLNGNSAKYQLLADELVNPFIPGIIDAFRCPEQL